MKAVRASISKGMTGLGIGFMRLLALLPLRWIRGLGVVLAWVLYVLVGSRRRVVHTNLRLCFSELNEAQRRVLARKVFVYFAQAWLDRSWLWHAPAHVVRRRLLLCGDVQALSGSQPIVIFSPHFVGLDAGWTALTQQISRAFSTIYTDQANRQMDRWILRGRRRFAGQPGSQTCLFGRVEGVKPIVSALRAGGALYLLPDMNFGPEESVFVPFFGVPAATVPSLSRFAKLGRAQVVPVISRLTSTGYEVRVLPAWHDFPTADAVADTALMNQRLESYIQAQPAQYYWVHKRFKTRPEGEPSVY